MRAAKGIPWWFAVGFVLLSIAAFEWLQRPISATEAELVFRDVLTVPVEELRTKAMNISVRLPDDKAWKRVAGSWGYPDFLIGIRSAPAQLDCWVPNGIVRRVTVDGTEAPVSIAEQPLYGYSSTCQEIGLRFHASPGRTARIALYRLGPNAQLQGELIVTPYWTSGVKDHLVGIDLARIFDRYILLAAVVGLAIVVGAFATALIRTR